MPVSMGICDSCGNERILGSFIVIAECELEMGTIAYVCGPCVMDLESELEPF